MPHFTPTTEYPPYEAAWALIGPPECYRPAFILDAEEVATCDNCKGLHWCLGGAREDPEEE